MLRLVRSAMPVALLYVGKLIVDQVIYLHNHPGVPDHSYLWKLIALEFALAIATDALNRVINLLESLLGDAFSNFTSIDYFEGFYFYKLLKFNINSF